MLRDRAVISGIADKYPKMRTDDNDFVSRGRQQAIQYAEGNDLNTLINHTSWTDRPRRGYDEALEDAKKRKAKAEAGRRTGRQQSRRAEASAPLTNRAEFGGNGGCTCEVAMPLKRRRRSLKRRGYRYGA